MGVFATLVVATFNFAQTIGWFTVLALLLHALYLDPVAAFWNPRLGASRAVNLYVRMQKWQIVDVLLPIFGFTRTNIISSAGQTGLRCVYGLISLPLMEEFLPIIFPTLMCFALVEPWRYGYNLWTTVGLKDTYIGRMFGFFRWNLFMVIYPLGAIGDGLGAVFCIPTVQASNPPMYSVTMPNKWNFAFSYLYFLYFLPVIYVLGFPHNYMYLLNKRRQYYAP